jgi:hypothetical protein
MKQYLVFLLLLTIMSSCQTSITRRNDADDMSRGMDLARDFYREVQAGNFEEATNFISHSDLSKEDALKLLTTIQTMRGDLDSVQTTTTGSVFTVAEGDTTEEQSIELKCFYTQGTSTEELVLKRKDGGLKIVGYQFNM